MRIKYYDERLMTEKLEKGLTESEANSRVGDLRIMEEGGKVSSITVEPEEE